MRSTRSTNTMTTSQHMAMVNLELQQQVEHMRERLVTAHSLNIVLLHKLGGQVTVVQEEAAQLTREFPYITLTTDPGFFCAKLCSEPPKGAV